MFTKILAALLVVFVGLMAIGCLTTEVKEYRFKVNADGSGEGTIKFINIVSADDDERDVSFKDFGELVTDYLEGSSFEDQNSQYKVTGKRLFEENGVLNGEVTFTFESLADVGFYLTADCDCAPVLYPTGSLEGTLTETNGTNLNETMNVPLISWGGDAKEYYIRSTVMDDMDNTRSLLSHWQDWKNKN